MSEKNENIHQMSSKALIGICSILVSIVLCVVGYISCNTLQKLAEIQRDIVSIRLKLTQLQTKMLTEQRVKQMIQYKLLQQYRIIK